MNAWEQMKLVRDLIGEDSAAHWTDVMLVKRLNAAQRKIALKFAMSPGQWLVKSASVTPVASVITLPSDCSKPIYLEETTSGIPISWLGSVTHRRVSRPTGANVVSWDVANEAYPLAATLEVNQDSYTTACTLWYQRRVPDLSAGDAAAGASTSLTLAADLNRVMLADYYNNVGIEQYNAAGATATYVALKDTISDYTAAGVCTITGTGTTGYAYGTISVLPEEAHLPMCYEAAADAVAKPSATIDDKAVARIKADAKELLNDLYAWMASRLVGGERVEVGEEF